jgi:hypothetical protein
MPKLRSASSAKGHEAVNKLLAAGGPVLVEVRIPGGFVSSHWYLCESNTDFDGLLNQLEPNAILHVNRVWDLTNRSGAIVLRR